MELTPDRQPRLPTVITSFAAPRSANRKPGTLARLARRAKPKATAFPRSNGAYNNFRLLLDRFIFCHDAEAMWAALNRTDRLMSRQDVDYSCTEHWLYGPAHRYLGEKTRHWRCCSQPRGFFYEIHQRALHEPIRNNADNDSYHNPHDHQRYFTDYRSRCPRHQRGTTK